MKKRIFALALALCLMLSLVPTMVFAEGCTHTHSDECYYKTECTHKCDEKCDSPCTHKCTVESGCITMKKDCKHTHNDDCGYKAAVEEVKCGCTDTNEDGSIKHSENCGYQAAVPEVKCDHVCSIESGCYKLQCTHAEEGQHDEKCGYKETTLTTAAPTGLQQQINDADEKATITLTGDVTLTETLTISKAITLNLDGHSITMTGEGNTISVADDVTLTISAGGTIYGKINGNVGAAGAYCIVTCKVNGETHSTQFVLRNSGYATKPTGLDKDGYTLKWTYTKSFDGTAKDEDGNAIPEGNHTLTFDFDTAVTEDLTLTATYEPITYHIDFVQNGGKGAMTTVDATYGQDVTLPENGFTRDGYTFTGWKDADGKTYGDKATVKNLTTTDGETVELFAQWEKNADPTPTEYTVTFDANGGSVTPETATTTNGKLSELPTPTRTGYTFDGWYTAKDGGEQVTTNTTFDKDTTIYAHWTAIKYSIHFYGGKGATGSMDAIKDIPYDQSVTLTENAFKKEGYTFTGWKGDNGKTYTDKESVKNLATVDNDVIELTAQWVKDSIPELTPVTSLTFYQSGYEYNKNVIDLKLQSSTGNKGITFPDGLTFGGAYGINTSESLAASKEVTSGKFESETQYFLYVEFQAAQGYTLNGLESKNVKLDGTSAKTLTVKDDTATAVFELPRIFLIKATAGSNGKIEPSGTVAVFEGENQTFTITPNTGYGISTMKIDGKSQTTKKTYTFKDVDDSHKITVTFAKSNGSAKTGDDLRLIWLAGAGVLSLAALVAIVIIHNKKKNSK